MTKPDDLRAALAALEFLSDRIYHQVFEDGSNGGDHIEAIRAALSQPAAPPSLGMEKVRLPTGRRTSSWTPFSASFGSPTPSQTAPLRKEPRRNE